MANQQNGSFCGIAFLATTWPMAILKGPRNVHFQLNTFPQTTNPFRYLDATYVATFWLKSVKQYQQVQDDQHKSFSHKILPAEYLRNIWWSYVSSMFGVFLEYVGGGVGLFLEYVWIHTPWIHSPWSMFGLCCRGCELWNNSSRPWPQDDRHWFLHNAQSGHK